MVSRSSPHSFPPPSPLHLHHYPLSVPLLPLFLVVWPTAVMSMSTRSRMATGCARPRSKRATCGPQRKVRRHCSKKASSRHRRMILSDQNTIMRIILMCFMITMATQLWNHRLQAQIPRQNRCFHHHHHHHHHRLHQHPPCLTLTDPRPRPLSPPLPRRHHRLSHHPLLLLLLLLLIPISASSSPSTTPPPPTPLATLPLICPTLLCLSALTLSRPLSR